MSSRPVLGPSGGVVLAPLAAAGAGLGGLAAVQQPGVAAGAAAGVLLVFLPWAALVVLLFVAATQQLYSVSVGGLTLRFEQMLLVPFFIRAILLSAKSEANRWRTAEWLLVVFVAFEVFTTYVNGFFGVRNFAPIGLAFFGAVAYLTVYMSIATRARLIFAARVLLIGVVVNATYGTIGFLSSIAFGTNFAVSKGLKELVKPAFGVSFESNIFGSTCAAGALIFLTLWRERNPLFSKRASFMCFCIAFAGMIASLTRGAWVGFAVVFVVWLLAPRRGIRRSGGVERVALLVMVLPFLALAVGYLAAATSSGTSGDVNVTGAIVQKAGDAFNFSSDTGRGRLIEWQTALADIKTSPIIGLGVNAFSFYHPNTGADARPAYIGNLWARVLYESGVIGLLLFAGFMAVVLWPNRTLLWSRGDLAPLARAFTFGAASLGIAYIGTDSMLLMWPWLLLGVTRAARILAKRQYAAMRRAAREAAPELNGGGAPPPNGKPLGLRGGGSPVRPDPVPWGVS